MIIVGVVVVIADQVSKYIMVEKVMRPEGVTQTPFFTDKIIEVLPFFQLRMAWNTGISFSMFNSGEAMTTALLLAVQVIVTCLVIWWLRQLDRPWLQVACGLIIGGAVGNIVDRALFGAVADFLDFYWGTWHFPTFNVADCCISVGAGLWLLDAVLDRPQAAATEDQTKDSAP
jgi:signal peptidase II